MAVLGKQLWTHSCERREALDMGGNERMDMSALDELRVLDGQRLMLIRSALREDQAAAVNYLKLSNPKLVQLLKTMSPEQMFQLASVTEAVGLFRIDDSPAVQATLSKLAESSGAIGPIDAVAIALQKS